MVGDGLGEFDERRRGRKDEAWRMRVAREGEKETWSMGSSSAGEESFPVAVFGLSRASKSGSTVAILRVLLAK